jgi:hypothetical protein
VQRIVAGKIDIRFEAGVVMNEIEVAFLSPGRFLNDDLARRAVEMRLIKRLDQFLDACLRQNEHEIDIHRQARLAVDHPGDAAGDEVSQSSFIERTSEKQHQISLGHSRRLR